MAEEATLVLIKPDAIQRGLMGAVVSRLEELRLEVIGAKAVQVSRELAEAHYDHLREKPFFQEIVEYLQGTLHETRQVVAFVLWGEDAIGRVRELTGATNPEQAHPTSIRGALGRMRTTGLMENVVHASSDRREAEREISLWFKPHELLRAVTRSASRLDERDR
ncbi:MAG: nucleoside-diphosphate kinase [Candidatus Omnitrophica bacterium]|nr:nucleoside-diphosphate kinase [Candidatus Omnitrophota bacterium]